MTSPADEKEKKDMADYNKKFREQLLGIKTKLEKLQSDFGCNTNFLLMIEDNVTEKINMRGRDSVSAGRVLCCGDGDLKKLFCDGKLSFEPSVMSFVQPGNSIQDDPQFLMDWAEAVKSGGQAVKQEADLQAASSLAGGSEVAGCNMMTNNVNMAVMANMLAQLQSLAAIKQEPGVDGQNAFGMNMNLNNIVKQEPIDESDNIDPSDFLAKDGGQPLAGLSGLNPFTMPNKIDPSLVASVADPRMRDYSVQELVNQAEGGVNYSCSFCDFKTFCSKRLSVHVRSLHKTGMKKLICKECKFSTLNKQTMSSHIMTEHRKDLIRCKEDKCNFYSFNVDTFRAHAEEHRKNVPTPGTALNFKCDFCNFKSSSRKGVGVHINRIHSEESPAMKMMQKRKNQRHEAKKQELQALIDKQRKLGNLE